MDTSKSTRCTYTDLRKILWFIYFYTNVQCRGLAALFVDAMLLWLLFSFYLFDIRIFEQLKAHSIQWCCAAWMIKRSRAYVFRFCLFSWLWVRGHVAVLVMLWQKFSWIKYTRWVQFELFSIVFSVSFFFHQINSYTYINFYLKLLDFQYLITFCNLLLFVEICSIWLPFRLR